MKMGAAENERADGPVSGGGRGNLVDRWSRGGATN
jgi:hypothetical protein